MANEKRLICAGDLWSDIMMLPHNGDMISSEEVEQAIMEAPIVDAVPVVHGRWFMRGGIFRCSECDSKALLKLDGNVGGCREYTHFRSNYCPNCGADMTERSEGE